MFIHVVDTTPAPAPIVGIASAKGAAVVTPVPRAKALPQRSSAAIAITSAPVPATVRPSAAPAVTPATVRPSAAPAVTPATVRPSAAPAARGPVSYSWRDAWKRAAPAPISDADRERIAEHRRTVALRNAEQAATTPPSDANRLDKFMDELRPQFSAVAAERSFRRNHGGYEDRGVEMLGEGPVVLTYYMGDLPGLTVHYRTVQTVTVKGERVIGAADAVFARRPLYDVAAPFEHHDYTHATIAFNGATVATVQRSEWLAKNPSMEYPEPRRSTSVTKDHRHTYNARQNKAPNSWFGRYGNEAAYR